MKLEKREITLNERDSILETAYTSKNLLIEYAFSLCHIKRKELRKEILKCMQETGDDVSFLFDLAEQSLGN